VAWYAQVHRVADVAAKLDRVVALRPRPVVHELELLFALGKRAIATTDVQPIAKGAKTASAAEIKAREASSNGRTSNTRAAIEPRYSKSVHGRGRRIGISCHRVVLEIAEPEVRQPLCTNRLRETRSQAVVVVDRRPIQASWAETRAAECSQAAFARQ